MLKLKDRLYLRKLIKFNEVYITKQDKKITDEDIKKIRYIRKIDCFANVEVKLLSKISLSQLFEIMGCYGLDWYKVVRLIEKECNLEEFIYKIVKKYPNYSDKVSDMIFYGYTIDQMEFLLENNMIYNMYHNEFDYEDIFKRCEEIGIDVTKEYCNGYPIEFLENLRKVGSPEECYELLDETGFFASTNDCIDICNLLIDKEFKLYEIILVIKKGFKVEQLKFYFSYGGTKEELMRNIALTL